MKQTAVEWFAERIQSNIIFNFENVLKQAKEMEEQQKGFSKEDLKQAFNVGFNVGYNDETSPSYLTFEKWFEQIKKK